MVFAMLEVVATDSVVESIRQVDLLARTPPSDDCGPPAQVMTTQLIAYFPTWYWYRAHTVMLTNEVHDASSVVPLLDVLQRERSHLRSP
jgi:hypothetical protein